MSHRVRFSDNAVADLDGIAEHIAGDNPVRAISFIDELQRRTIDMLSVFPESGTRYKGLTRFLVFSGYIVLYEIDIADQTVNVLDIVHGRRNWKKSDARPPRA